MTLRIEPIPLTAAAALSRLHRSCFTDDPWDCRAMAEILAMPGFFGHVAWDGDTAVGFVLALDLGGDCEILSLGVVRERRRSGAASALVAAALGEAEARGARAVFLETAVDNDAAQSLYARLGFALVGRRAGYYQRRGGTMDALVLQRPLRPLAT